MATALFVCLHNAGRSQMSAALLERAANDATARSQPAAKPTRTAAFTPRSSR
jgi:protein-tyrosine-phosphatase